MKEKTIFPGEMGVADFVFAPQLEALPVVKIDTEAFPNIQAWTARMRAKPYWTTA